MDKRLVWHDWRPHGILINMTVKQNSHHHSEMSGVLALTAKTMVDPRARSIDRSIDRSGGDGNTQYYVFARASSLSRARCSQTSDSNVRAVQAQIV